MSSFIYDDTPLYATKTDRSPPTDQDKQWTADNCNLVRTALADIRTFIEDHFVSVLWYGAVGNGVADDTIAIQAALGDTAGRTLYFPKGKYKVTSTLTITSTSHHLVGDFSNRFVDNGTQIVYNGTGPCIQIGVDNGHAWDVGDYDGPQDHKFSNLTITHGAPDTVLVSSGDAVNPKYKANAYGIWDWRGGGIRIFDCWIEQFEANFVGINSDINHFHTLTSAYSKFGIYLGPRSDQQVIDQLYSFFCDRAITVDRANRVLISGAQVVACGTSTESPIEIRRGSIGCTIESPWFEHLTGAGYQGTDQPSFVSVGEVNGYGAGGSISSPGGTPTTTKVAGCAINHATVETVPPATAGHTKYVASIGKCDAFSLDFPAARSGTSLGSFDTLVAVPAAQSPANTDTHVWIRGIDAALSESQIFQNLGAGAPVYLIETIGSSGLITYPSAPMTVQKGLLGAGGSVGAGLTGTAINIAVSGLNSATGQTANSTGAVRGRQDGTYDATAASRTAVGVLGDARATKSAGGNSLNNIGVQATATNGDNNIALQTVDGEAQFNSSSGTSRFLKSVRFASEVNAGALGANQNDWQPGADAYDVLVSASIANVDITGIVSSSAGGRDLYVYNIGAANTITLKHLNGGSAAGNQIIGRGAADVVLNPKQGVLLRYSANQSKWIVRHAP